MEVKMCAFCDEARATTKGLRCMKYHKLVKEVSECCLAQPNHADNDKENKKED